MTRVSSAFFAGLLVVSAFTFVAGVHLQTTAVQAQRPPDSQASQSPASKSTALLLGQVTDGSTGRPVPEAVVLLRPVGPGGRTGGGPNPAAVAGLVGAMAGDAGGNPAFAAAMAAAMARAAGGGTGSAEQRLMTGADGRFVFHSLPPGQYQLSVSLSGYAASLGAVGEANLTLLFAGQGRGGASAAASYTLGEGEMLSDIRLRVWKHAAVTGTVFDDAGEPAVGIAVHAMRRTLVGGRARYAPSGIGRTDDRGMYRIGALLPGDYLIVTPQTQTAVPAAMMEQLVNVGLTGRPGAVDQSTMAAFAQLMATSGGNVGAAMSSGVRLGGDMVASASGALPIVSPDGRLFAYRTAFYADASTPVEASIVSLTSGDERAGADFQLRLTPTVRVSGVAIGSEGPVANLPVRLVVPGDRIMSDTEFDVATSITTADGRFSFYGVPPGQFLLRAQKMPMPGFAPAPGSPSDAPLFAAMNLPVDTTEIEDLTVRLSEALTISGRVEFESQKGAAAPAAPKGAGLMLLPADGQTPNILALGRPTPIGSDGTFRREGIVPGRYFFNLVSVPAPWQVKGATLDGRDVYDRPLEIRTGDLANVVVTLTDQLAQLSGIVSAPVSFTSAEAVVILFPADYRTWIDSGMNPRLVRTAPVAASGTYTVPNLTAGDYLAVAIDRGDEGDLQDPAFIEILSRAATRVSIAADARAQSLTVARVRR